MASLRHDTAAVEFASRLEARHLLAFHHDPGHDDSQIDAMFEHVDRPTTCACRSRARARPVSCRRH